MTTPIRHLLACFSIAIGLGVVDAPALPVSSAQASLINLNRCHGAALSQPFASWGDAAWYELAPGGDFESATWMLDGGAQLVAGSEPYAATGTLGAWSLSLPAGSSAQSPSTCVVTAYPTIRFFIAGSGSVAVDVVDENLDMPAGIAVASGDWLPTPVMPQGLTLRAGVRRYRRLSVQLTGVSGDPQVDAVFIDPWNRG